MTPGCVGDELRATLVDGEGEVQAGRALEQQGRQVMGRSDDRCAQAEPLAGQARFGKEVVQIRDA